MRDPETAADDRVWIAQRHPETKRLLKEFSEVERSLFYCMAHGAG